MLFSTLSQGWLFLIFLIAGFCAQTMRKILQAIWAKIRKKPANIDNSHHKNVWTNARLAFEILLFAIIWWWLNLKLNYGIVRIYTIIAFCGGFYLSKAIFAHLLPPPKNVLD